MESFIIFCAGEFDTLAEPVRQGDRVVAADGGLRHLQRLGILPDSILGDFDSLGYVPQGAAVYPVEKDDTDAMLALRQGLSLGYRRFILYGAMDGPRLDHTLANLQALQFLADRGAQGYLVGTGNIATVIKNAALTFPEGAEGTVSVFCMGPDAHGVTLQGLQYPLEGGDLTASFPLGVSNHFTGRSACIRVADGSLLVLWERKNGLSAAPQA